MIQSVQSACVSRFKIYSIRGNPMSKSLRCLTIALIDIPNEYKIAFSYLTYHSGKLFNQAPYLIKTKKLNLIPTTYTTN